MQIRGRDFVGPLFNEWYTERPPVIQELIVKCPPGAMMVNEETGQLMEIISWFEDGTVKAGVRQELNNHLTNALPDDYAVFGLSPDGLEFYCWGDDEDKISSWHGLKGDKE